ncbi:MAG TPA: ParA family protein [Anaerolineaceae bacterium]|nr:ParA family protein [Anaerolineaceae bacterium]HPN52662.1 ParA family protein [Anaerolineaceae bacterium]
MSYIIAVSNEKGGVAKTTTSLSLGAALVESGKEVLLIDMDAQANLTLALGIEPDKSRRAISNILLESATPASVSRETGIPGLDIIPSNSEMGMAERFLPLRENYQNILRDALRSNGLYYPYIILDCPPFLGAVTTNAIMAADMLLVPTQPEYFSIHALKNMIALIRRLRNEGNPTLTYRLLITMHDRRNRTHRTLSEQLRTTFGNGVLQTVINTDTKLRESPIAGLPIIYYAPKSRAANEYRTLAQEVIQHAQETTQQPA